MQSNLVYTQFKNLARGDENSNAFNVISLPNSKHKLGVSVEGFPKFFVCTNDSAATYHNIVLELLSVEYNQPCTIIEDAAEPQSDTFSIITLRANEEALQAYFIDIIIMILSNLSDEPSREELSIEIENLITIFSALRRKPIKEIQGVWAELLVIEHSLHPETLISAWHSQPNAKFDFTMGRDKIEVKSTSSEERKHHFALDQLNPSINSRLLIASVIVRESAKCAGALSVKGLYEKICSRVSTVNLQLKLYSTLATVIGNDYKNWDSVFFDYVEASDTLFFYNVDDVPRIKKSDVPEFVNEVKFSSDLTHLIDIKDSHSNFDRSDSVLFKSLF